MSKMGRWRLRLLRIALFRPYFLDAKTGWKTGADSGGQKEWRIHREHERADAAVTGPGKHGKSDEGLSGKDGPRWLSASSPCRPSFLAAWIYLIVDHPG